MIFFYEYENVHSRLHTQSICLWSLTIFNAFVFIVMQSILNDMKVNTHLFSSISATFFCLSFLIFFKFFSFALALTFYGWSDFTLFDQLKAEICKHFFNPLTSFSWYFIEIYPCMRTKFFHMIIVDIVFHISFIPDNAN